MSEELKAPGAYILLGSAHEDRWKTVSQLVRYLIYNDEEVTLCIETSETLPEIPDLKQALDKGLKENRWSLNSDETGFELEPEFSAAGGLLFWVSRGDTNPVSLVEILSNWLPLKGIQVERVITWVDSERCSQSSSNQKWYEACIHFSDFALLDRYKNLDSSWPAQFIEHFENEHYPCIIERMKKGRVRDESLVLDNQVRRITQIFDPVDNDDEEQILDPYFERLPDGRRSKVVPDIV